jgi:hypothetical protein
MKQVALFSRVLRGSYHGRMLLALVPKKVVFARKAVEIAATRMIAAVCMRSQRRVTVFALVSMKVLGIEEAIATGGASMRPLRTVQMGLLVTAGIC